MIRALGLPLVCFYAAALGAIGCAPFFGVVLGETGWKDDQIPLALLGLPIGVLTGGPVWAWIADRLGSPVRVLRLATVLAVGAGASLVWVQSAFGLAVALGVWAFVRAPHLALADTIAVRRLGDDRRSYGSVRAIGSAMFLVVALIGSVLRDVHPRGPMMLSLGLLVVAAAVAFAVPDDGERPPTPPPLRDVLALVVRFAPLVIVGVLHGIALVAFDNFWALRAERLQLPSWAAGTGIALAVAVEVAVMVGARPILDRIGAERMIAVAVAAGVVQWWGTAELVTAAPLVLLQAVRGVAFGAFWVAGVAILSERSPPGLAASAQALLPAATFGVGAIACMLLARATLVDTEADLATLFHRVMIVEFAALMIALVAVRGRTARG